MREQITLTLSKENVEFIRKMSEKGYDGNVSLYLRRIIDNLQESEK